MQQALNAFTVADHVQLKPERRRAGGLHFGQRADADGGERKGHPGGIGGAHRLHFATFGHHARQPHRGQHHRHAAVLTGEGGAGIDLIDIHQHALTQPDT